MTTTRITKSQLKKLIRESVLKEQQSQNVPLLRKLQIYLPTAGFTPWKEAEVSSKPMPVIGSKFSLIPGYMDVKCYIQLEEGGNCTVYAFPSVIGPSTEGFHERVQGGVSPNKVGDVVLELIQKVANLIIERMQDRIANA